MRRATSSAMRWALLFDAPLLLLVPAVLFVGAVAGARQSRVAAVGAGLAFMGTLAAVFLLANDILLYEAATSNTPGAIALIDGYQHNALFATMLVLYLVGQAIGCVLLAIVLWRRRAVPPLGRRRGGCLPDHRTRPRPGGRRACRRRLRSLRADVAPSRRQAVAGRYVRTTHASAHLSRQVDEWTCLAGPSTC